MPSDSNYKLTLDSGLEAGYPSEMVTLKRWMTESKIVLVEANPSQSSQRMAWSGASPKPKYKPKPKSNGIFREVAAALFSHQDCQKLNLTETNCVAHIAQHLASQNEFFVTANLKNFVLEGKRERLKRSFGVVVLTPDEAVTLLSNRHGWK